jgi:hypothetical protein
MATEVIIGHTQDGAPTHYVSTSQVGIAGGLPKVASNVMPFGYTEVPAIQSITVTNTAAALPTVATKHVKLRAALTNTIPVWVGRDSGVTVGDGWELFPGDTLDLPITNPNLLFVIAASSGPRIDLMGFN